MGKIKPDGYWYDFDNLSREIKVISKNGIFPTHEEITLKLGGARQALKYFGGIKLVAKKMGFNTKERTKGYWKNRDNLINELSKFNGIFPTAKELRNELGSGAESAIRNFGGRKTISEIMGINLQNKSKGYWNDFSNLEQEIIPLVISGVFPSLQLIGDNLGQGAVKSIAKNGGVRIVASKMGYKHQHSFVASDGHVLDSHYELIVDEYLKKEGIPHDVHGLIVPKRKFRYDFKICGFFVELWGFPKDDLTKIRVRYNENRKIKMALYKSLNIEPISLEYADFRCPISETIGILKSKFEKCFQKN